MNALAALLQIIGAVWLSLKIDSSFVGYWIMGVGAILMIEIAQRSRSIEFFVMWVIFFVINVVGILRYTPWT